jgi:peptide deformylase
VTGDVLLVDDNPVNIRRLAEILKPAGVAVRAATSAVRALEAARAQPPDLVLLDVEMPDRNGFDVCAELAADPSTEGVRVVFVSAHDDRVQKSRAFRAGAVDWLTKPFDAEEVLARVATQLELVRLAREGESARRLVSHDVRGLVAGMRALARQLRSTEGLWSSSEGPAYARELEHAGDDALATLDLLRGDTDELPILVEGDERLRVRSAKVEAVDERLRGEIRSCAATLDAFRRRNGFGRAISAPQVGIARRLIVIDLGAGPFAVVNPEIVWRSEELFEVWDDCFSVPDKLVRVRRHRSISLVHRDERFRERRWERLPPDLSELLQHEIDHLDGVLMTDRAHGEDAIRPASERGLVEAARPARRISLERIVEAARTVDAVFRDTPQYVCEPLAEELGCVLTLKVETLNPIRSFKGRGADFYVARRAPGGAPRPIVCASAGNFGQALAYSCRKRSIPLVVFAARDANALKLARMRALGADVRAEGDDFDNAMELAKTFAEGSGRALVVDGREPEITEGAGTIGVELLARGEAFDAVVVPLGDGALINGIARWVKAASPSTRVVGVAAAGAPALAESWRLGPGAAAVTHPSVETIADGIAVRIPVSEALADMHGLVDDVLLVSDEDILRAMRLVHRHAGLVLEPAGAAAVAALVADRSRFAGAGVAAVLSGGNVTPEQAARWLSGDDR